MLAAWVEAGAPEGSGSAPELPVFATGWKLGEPDMVVSMEAAYTVPPDGPDIYRNFPARVPTTEDKWDPRHRISASGEDRGPSQPIQGRSQRQGS